MSAAHELIERGFEVLVLERGRLAGGKARSISVVESLSIWADAGFACSVSSAARSMQLL